MKNKKILFCLFVIVVLLIQACNLPSANATEVVDPMVAAQSTITALAQTQQAQLAAIPTNTAQPTFTALPTLSPTPEATFTPAFTSTPTFAYVTLSEATNCRVGPGTAYSLLDTFLVGQTIEVVGKHPFDNYWYVRSPKNANVYCWLWGAYATGANLNNVPVLTPPPSPTPAPTGTFTAEYVNSGKCVSWWTRINLTNKGTVPFKSMSVSIKDTVTDETRNSSGDGFQDVNACVLSAKAPILGPGDAYTIVSPSLSADPAGHKLSVTITLCPNTGQGGACVSQTIEFKP
ncbi:MAG: SH3 domain-containing protein [Anaerolineales bacterium]|nr:SH3 domain-containing protein [Anaerolineales bacterium]